MSGVEIFDSNYSLCICYLWVLNFFQFTYIKIVFKMATRAVGVIVEITFISIVVTFVTLVL
ncbi:hypothetical protein GCM10007963_02100 [Lutibacter litoralis]|nr:hypothetical protein GCM10007963_02100 [Lutibacter litoralis]